MLLINEEWIDGLEAEVAARMGSAADDLRPRLAAVLVNSAMRGAIDTWVAADGRLDLDAVVAQAFGVIRPSIVELEAGWTASAPVSVDG
jgi:transcriptional regulator MftR-like protein